MKVIYPVLFYEEKEGGYSVFVPDLQKALNTSASTCGSTLEEAMSMAEDLIAGLVLDEMEDGKQIPQASKIEDVSFEELEKSLDIQDWDYVSKFKTYIAVDINMYAEKWGKELSFEKNISINQNLTFNYADMVFKNKNLSFGDIEKKNLGLINSDNKYTNLALLLSDQCPFSIKVARYKDNTKTEFLDSKEFGNESILSQLENVYNYLMLINRVSSKIDGLERIDTYDYPKNTLREILCNIITHRNYEINGSNLIHIFNDKIEFLSLGGLVAGLTVEDIKLGSSSSRNPNLVNIFHRLNFVEAYGTGIPRMYEEYRASTTSPEIKIAPNSFLVILPKLNIKNEYSVVIRYLRANIQGSRENFESILKLSKNATINILNEMLEKGIIEKAGSSKNIIYKLK